MSYVHIYACVMSITVRFGLAALRLARLARFGFVQCLMRKALLIVHAQDGVAGGMVPWIVH